MINVTIEGTDRAVAHITKMGEGVRVSVHSRMLRLVQLLRRKVRVEKLSGQVLHRRTGNLSRSIDTAVIESPHGEIGIVSTNVKYGRFWEYGFHGVQTVKAHMRTVKATGTTSVVRSHARKVNVGARSFLRSALAEMAPQINEELRTAVNAGLKMDGVK